MVYFLLSQTRGSETLSPGNRPVKHMFLVPGIFGNKYQPGSDSGFIGFVACQANMCQRSISLLPQRFPSTALLSGPTPLLRYCPPLF